MQLIILDRDGVINEERERGIQNPEEFIPLPGSIEAIVSLKRNGYNIAIATNQSGIGRGYYTEEDFAAIQCKLEFILNKHNVSIDIICHCPHKPTDECNCRKPKTGMLDKILQYFSVKDASQFYLVGDSKRDLDMAKARKVNPVLVTTGHGHQTLQDNPEIANSAVIYSSLKEFVTKHLKLPV